MYTTLAFLALLGDPYIYDISSLRVKKCLMVLVHCLAVSLIYRNERVSTLTRVFSDAWTQREKTST